MSSEPTTGVNKRITDNRVQHLFLLLGLNPLPNYVAARTLLQPGGKLHLVYSAWGDTPQQGSPSLLERLTLRLQALGIEIGRRVLVEEADRDDIFDRVQEAAKSLPSDETIGLHYTGGTKAMSTHAYRALEQWGERAGRRILFSYLDARTCSVAIEPLKERRGQTIPLIPWPSAVAIGGEPPALEDLVALHAETLIPADPAPPPLIETARELAKACAHGPVANAYRRWLNGVIEPLRSRSDDNDGWLAEEALQTRTLEWWVKTTGRNNANLLRGPRAALEKAFGQPSGGRAFSLAQARQHTGDLFKSYAELVGWIDGHWLEYFVQDCIQRIAQESGIQKPQRSIEILPDTAMFETVTRKYNEKTAQNTRDLNTEKFELDVVAMRGYQLFGISCTTSQSKTLNKKKLLEAVVRAQQLGGDEARIGLVTFFYPPEILDYELSKKFRLGSQIRIFSTAHLKNLPAALKEWFRQG